MDAVMRDKCGVCTTISNPLASENVLDRSPLLQVGAEQLSPAGVTIGMRKGAEEAEREEATSEKREREVRVGDGVAGPWSMWARLQTIGQRAAASGAEEHGGGDAPNAVGAQREMAASRSAARKGGADTVGSCSAAMSLPSSYRARWPSLWARVAACMRPLWDIYFVVALFVLYATPVPADDSPQAWRLVKKYSAVFVWIPFVYRFFTGFLHWVLSLVMLPGCILYMQGPALKMLPKGLQETINESNAVRSKRRDELLATTHGTAVHLITPDGAHLDAIYWAGQGQGTTRDGPTVVRLNGNAEAFELQDDMLPLMYSTRGINVLLFNYRGVGGSHWAPVCGSAGLGQLLGIWCVPAAAGLQLDAWTAVQFLLQHLRVPPEKICVVGHSIGGAVAAKFLAAHPQLPIALCCSRSFAYMSSIAGHLAPLFLSVEPTSCKASCLSSFTCGLVYWCGWQHCSVANFHRAKGRKWLEYSTADHIIPLEISLPAAIRARHLKGLAKDDVELGGQGVVDLETMGEGRGVLAGLSLFTRGHPPLLSPPLSDPLSFVLARPLS